MKFAVYFPANEINYQNKLDHMIALKCKNNSLFSGLGKLEARTICRNFERRNLVIICMNDQGKQRTTNFVAKKFEHLSQVRVVTQMRSIQVILDLRSLTISLIRRAITLWIN